MCLASRCLKERCLLVEVRLETSRNHTAETNRNAGGGGNLYKPTEEELAKNRENNKYVRSASFNKDRNGLKGLADKAKNALSGGNKEGK